MFVFDFPNFDLFFRAYQNRMIKSYYYSVSLYIYIYIYIYIFVFVSPLFSTLTPHQSWPNCFRETWADLLQAVHCTILSSTHNEYMDAFVLSESSMFITPYRFILKTCGQTTLLHALEKLLALAASLGLVCEELFFCRPHLRRPELQPYPHQSFGDEVNFLDQVFGKTLVHRWEYIYIYQHFVKLGFLCLL